MRRRSMIGNIDIKKNQMSMLMAHVESETINNEFNRIYKFLNSKNAKLSLSLKDILDERSV